MKKKAIKKLSPRVKKLKPRTRRRVFLVDRSGKKTHHGTLSTDPPNLLSEPLSKELIEKIGTMPLPVSEGLKYIRVDESQFSAGATKKYYLVFQFSNFGFALNFKKGDSPQLAIRKLQELIEYFKSKAG
ncbi:MAG: hypothetical protein ABSC54_00740 [Smithellaceae bacterium]|jgi:hypothetical protein